MDATTLVSVFHQMLHELSNAFTRPTAETFRQLAVGWVLTPHAGTVTGMIRTLGPAATKHWTVYQKFFYRASWSMDHLASLLLRRVVGPLLEPDIRLAIDDTTCGPRGKHVALAGWFKDASSHARGPVIHWAHNWVVGAVILRVSRFPRLRLALPVLFALHRKKIDCDPDHPYATLPQQARQIVCRVAQTFPEKRVFVAMDGLYATRDFFGDLPPHAVGISRLRKNASLRQWPVAPRKGRPGRRRLRGVPLPSLAELTRRVRDWKTVRLLKQGRKVTRRIHGFTCQWYHVCPRKPVRVVIVQDPSGAEDDLHVVCTDPSVPDAQIVQRFYDRWGIEECIQEGKQQMGMERTRGWCAKTVSRQAPLAMLLASLVKLWYVQHAAGTPLGRPVPLPWYPQKLGTSFRDMLAALRRALWQKLVLCKLHTRWKSNQLTEAFAYALCEAA
jgi:hypothetical protein